MSRQAAMQQLRMSVFVPKRRRKAGYVAKWQEPDTGEWRQKTLRSPIKRDAYQKAGELAERIVAGISLDGLPWLEFCRLYEQQHLARRSPDTVKSWATVKWLVDDLAPLRSIQAANARWVARWLSALHERGTAQNTVATYAARIRAALRWAERQGYIARAPHVPVEWVQAPRSRAITLKEFRSLLAVVSDVRKQDFLPWKRLLRGQWESGLRISELLRLSWDANAAVALLKPGQWPLIRFGQQKSKKRQWAAVTPEFWGICCEVPEIDRQGLVFPLPGRKAQMSIKRVIRVISEIGETSGIVTNDETGKTATSHDLRRSFGERMIEQLGAVGAQRQLRHAKLETTLTWYDTRDAEHYAAILWEKQ